MGPLDPAVGHRLPPKRCLARFPDMDRAGRIARQILHSHTFPERTARSQAGAGVSFGQRHACGRGGMRPGRCVSPLHHAALTVTIRPPRFALNGLHLLGSTAFRGSLSIGATFLLCSPQNGSALHIPPSVHRFEPLRVSCSASTLGYSSTEELQPLLRRPSGIAALRCPCRQPDRGSRGRFLTSPACPVLAEAASDHCLGRGLLDPRVLYTGLSH